MGKKCVVNLLIGIVFIILMLILGSCSKSTNTENIISGNETQLLSEEHEEKTPLNDESLSINEIETVEVVYTETESSTDMESVITDSSEISSDLSLDTSDENLTNNEISLVGKWESADRPPDELQISEISDDVISIELYVFRYFTIHAEGNKNDTGFVFEDKEKGIKGTITVNGESIIVSVSDLGSFSGDDYLTWHLANIEFNKVE